MISKDWIEGKCIMVGCEQFLCKSIYLATALMQHGCEVEGARLSKDNSRVWLIFKTTDTLIKALDECSDVPIKLLKTRI